MKSPKSVNGSLYTNDLLKIGEAAKTLGVTVAAIRKMCDEGKLAPIVSESGHRFFNTKEVFNMKAKIENTLAPIDYVEKAKSAILQKKNKHKELKAEFMQFNGNTTGVELEVVERLCENVDDGSIKKWIIVKHGGLAIFAASHSEEETYQCRCFVYNPEHKPQKKSGSHPKMSKIGNVWRASKGVLLETFVNHLSNINQ